MPTPEEIEQKRERVAELRQQIAERDAQRHAEAAERTREIEAERLDREAKRLESVLNSGQQEQGLSDTSGGASGQQEQTRPATQPPADNPSSSRLGGPRDTQSQDEDNK